MTKIYLIRHGETAENYHKKLCGWTDAPLNDQGRWQAERLGEALKGLDIYKIYTSTLRRTIETAAYIAKENPYSISSIEDLKELNFGRVEGLTMAEVEAQYPSLYQRLREDAITFQFPQGESLGEMHRRVSLAIEGIIEENEGKNIVIVGHSGVIRSIIAHLLTGDIKYHWNFKIDHCSISVIEKTENFYVLTKLNETCHLIQ